MPDPVPPEGIVQTVSFITAGDSLGVQILPFVSSAPVVSSTQLMSDLWTNFVVDSFLSGTSLSVTCGPVLLAATALQSFQDESGEGSATRLHAHPACNSNAGEEGRDEKGEPWPSKARPPDVGAELLALPPRVPARRTAEGRLAGGPRTDGQPVEEAAARGTSGTVHEVSSTVAGCAE